MHDLFTRSLEDAKGIVKNAYQSTENVEKQCILSAIFQKHHRVVTATMRAPIRDRLSYTIVKYIRTLFDSSDEDGEGVVRCCPLVQTVS